MSGKCLKDLPMGWLITDSQEVMSAAGSDGIPGWAAEAITGALAISRNDGGLDFMYTESGRPYELGAVYYPRKYFTTGL